MFSLRTPARRQLAALALVAIAASGLAACDSSSADPSARGESPSLQGGSTDLGDDGTATADPQVPKLTTNVLRKRNVAVDKQVQVGTDLGRLTDVSLSSSAGDVDGSISSDGRTWSADGLLEPGATYKLKATADNDGTPTSKTAVFHTVALTLDEQTYPSVAPLQGETVGVGMPVIVSFDLPVTDKANFEKHMTVTSKPAQQGSWDWISDTEAHWRPKSYWKAGSKVHVDVDVNSVSAGNGVFGQEDRVVDFKVGDAHIYKVNAATHQMKVFSNGKLLRTLPITTGKPGFTTRSGVKVIIEKFPTKRMNSETVGISGSEAYDIDNVQWAMRITYSGEFIHAAPWSVGSQGYANVSHGCTGMSTANADWLYHMTMRGDVVETVGTDRPMEPTNGYGDWNVPWKSYKQGSAL